ncbi:Fc.00g046550.m01.CDS01 [Cosmosporella sp. VM-42]
MRPPNFLAALVLVAATSAALIIPRVDEQEIPGYKDGTPVIHRDGKNMHSTVLFFLAFHAFILTYVLAVVFCHETHGDVPKASKRGIGFGAISAGTRSATNKAIAMAGQEVAKEIEEERKEKKETRKQEAGEKGEDDVEDEEETKKEETRKEEKDEKKKKEKKEKEEKKEEKAKKEKKKKEEEKKKEEKEKFDRELKAELEREEKERWLDPETKVTIPERFFYWKWVKREKELKAEVQRRYEAYWAKHPEELKKAEKKWAAERELKKKHDRWTKEWAEESMKGWERRG